jgi:hypothetical protein
MYERNVVVAFLTVRHLESIGFPPKGGWLLWVGDVQLEGCGKLCWQRATYVTSNKCARGMRWVRGKAEAKQGEY